MHISKGTFSSNSKGTALSAVSFLQELLQEIDQFPTEERILEIELQRRSSTRHLVKIDKTHEPKVKNRKIAVRCTFYSVYTVCIWHWVMQQLQFRLKALNNNTLMPPTASVSIRGRLRESMSVVLLIPSVLPWRSSPMFSCRRLLRLSN